MISHYIHIQKTNWRLHKIQLLIHQFVQSEKANEWMRLMHVSYTLQVLCTVYCLLGCQLIINHGKCKAAKQGRPFSRLVTLSCLPVAPLPDEGLYPLSLSPHSTPQSVYLLLSGQKQKSETVRQQSYPPSGLLHLFLYLQPISYCFSSGDYGHNVIQHSCFAGYSCALSAYTCTSFIWAALLYSAVCKVTGGGWAGHFDIPEGNRCTCNIILASKDIPYPGTRHDLWYAMIFVCSATSSVS